MKIYSHITFVFVLILAFGCGGGGGSGSDVTLDDVVGKWTGSVDLFENGCERVIPDEFLGINFVHEVSLKVSSPDKGDLTLIDGNTTCYAFGADAKQNEFFAVCPETILPGFIEGYECKEELTWHYTVTDPVGTNYVNPVTRTSRISCYKESLIQFVCPVEYRGTAGRCIRDLC